DGNGRTARALFYWSMLSQGYWLTEYLTVSRELRHAPAQYARSILYTETDDLDFTYFILHQLDVTLRAIEELERYLVRKTGEIAETERRLRRHADLNHRQRALISHALRHPDAVYTIASHTTSHGTAYGTARTDLLDLERRDLLERRQVGRRFQFHPAGDLAEKAPDE
nr:Fic family protein [Chloroflexota bacterium]